MAITIHHSDRLDPLAEGLAGVLNEAGLAPFETEHIALPSRGMGRWLDQMLSHHLRAPGGGVRAGISAGLEYHNPRHLAELFLPDDGGSWRESALAWEVLTVVADASGQDWAQPLTALMRGENRYAAARRVAGLLLSYASERPAMLRAWGLGQDTDGEGPLPPDLSWQPELYRRLVDHLGALPPPLRAAEAAHAAAARGLPRFHTFGHSRLAAADVEFLGELSAHLHVHVWLPLASPALWGPEAPRGLLGEFGALAAANAAELAAALPAAQITDRSTPTGGDSLLARVQRDVRQNQAPAPGAGADATIELHSCYGPSRQVEVLREVLTGIFQDDPTLEPRDVLILCTDIDTYAPLLHATFNRDSGHPGSNLRVQVADRGSAATNPLFELAHTLLTLATGRTRATDLIELLHREEVRRRLQLDHDQVAIITEWVQAAGLRWGWDAADRDSFGVPTERNTIEAGLRALLLGVGQSEPLGETLPVPVGSSDVATLGVFAEFLARLRRGLNSLAAADTAGQWAEHLATLLGEISVGEDWQETQIARTFAELATYPHTPVSAADIRAVLTEHGAVRSPGLNFRSGALTVASFVPMRAVPHRLVCLIGMDDGAFPRPPRADGEDILARRPRPGEWDPVAEDRGLFLDSLLSATEKVIITYTGAGERRGEPLPPAGPVARLLTALAAMTGAAGDVITQHPLHPFDASYFAGGHLRSFDRRNFAASAGGQERPRPPLFAGPGPEVDVAEGLTLHRLKGFAVDPVKAFFTDRLGVRLPDDETELPTEIPIELNGLERWVVGERLLAEARQSEWTRPDLAAQTRYPDVPPGSVGLRTLGGIAESVEQIRTAAQDLAAGQAETIEIDTVIAGTTVRGRVGPVHKNTIVLVTYSQLGWKQKVRLWIDLLAAVSAHPDRDWAGLALTRDMAAGEAWHLRAPEPEQARELLAQLIDLYHAGQREPLPLPLGTSAAWVQAYRKSGGVDGARDSARRAATRTWEVDQYHGPGSEAKGPYQQLAWGGVVPFDELLAHPPRPGEQWYEQPTRFEQLALRLWDGLADHAF